MRRDLVPSVRLPLRSVEATGDAGTWPCNFVGESYEPACPILSTLLTVRGEHTRRLHTLQYLQPLSTNVASRENCLCSGGCLGPVYAGIRVVTGEHVVERIHFLISGIPRENHLIR
jgi:hypothetical protein